MSKKQIKMFAGLLEDNRGVGSSLSYALILAISAILLIGLVSSTGAILDTNTDRAAQSQLQIIGNQIAAEAMGLDRVAQRDDSPSSIEIKISLPDRAAGTQYIVETEDGTPNDKLLLTGTGTEQTVEVPLRIDSTLEENKVGGGDMKITYSSGKITLES